MYIYKRSQIFWRQRKKRQIWTQAGLTTPVPGRKLAPLMSSYWPSTPRPDACNPVSSFHCQLLRREDSNRTRVLFWGECQQHRSGPQLWLRTNSLGCQLAPESLSTMSGSSCATFKSGMKRLCLTSVNRHCGISFILLDNFHISCKELKNTQRVCQPWVRVWKWFSDVFDCSLSIIPCAGAFSWDSALPFFMLWLCACPPFWCLSKWSISTESSEYNKTR